MTPAGIVIGAHRMPSAVRLNLAAVRHTCGGVPVLVVEDHPADPGVRAACDEYGARHFLRADGRPLGHGQGDLQAFHAGLTWAKNLGLRVLCKLSQRMIVTKPDWLAGSAAALVATGLPAGSDRAADGDQRYGLRTEAVLMDVGQWWAHPPAIRAVTPRVIWPRAAEDVVADAIDTFGRGLWCWPLLGGPDRQRWAPGVVWYRAGGRTQYEALAAELGVTLGDDFHAGWSSGREGYTRG